MKSNSVFRYIDTDSIYFDKKYIICDKSVKRMFEVGDFPPLKIQNWRFGFMLGEYRRENEISMKDICPKRIAMFLKSKRKWKIKRIILLQI